jgi:hypothetical protein
MLLKLAALSLRAPTGSGSDAISYSPVIAPRRPASAALAGNLLSHNPFLPAAGLRPRWRGTFLSDCQAPSVSGGSAPKRGARTLTVPQSSGLLKPVAVHRAPPSTPAWFTQPTQRRRRSSSSGLTHPHSNAGTPGNNPSPAPGHQPQNQNPTETKQSKKSNAASSQTGVTPFPT